MIYQPDFATYFAKVATGMDGLSGPLNGVAAEPEPSVTSGQTASWAARAAAAQSTRSRTRAY